MSNSDQQHQINQHNQQTKRKRRQRNDYNNRDYICSCGKSYLSYPALYTHIKTKHQGKAPGTIQMPRTQKGNKLKKYNFKQQRSENEGQSQNGQDSLKQIIQFLNSIDQTSENYSVFDLFDKFNEEDKTPLLQAIKDWEQNRVNEVLQSNGTYNTTIDHVMAKFILNLTRKVSKTVLIESIMILIIWRQCINKNYRNFDKSNIYGIYTKEANASNMIEIVNELILSYFAEEQKVYRNVCQKMLSSTKKQYNLCKFIFIFSKWIFAQKYTNSKLQYNNKK